MVPQLDNFFLQKGIKQGDPLSPFLFIIGAESLNYIFQEALHQGSISGIRISEDGPFLTHLQFADDTLIFCGAALEEIKNLKCLLNGFEVMSRLKINYHKSVVCGVGMDQSQTTPFAKILGCKAQALPIKYLGMPLGANSKLKSTWNPVIQSIISNLPSWKKRALSFGGRLC